MLESAFRDLSLILERRSANAPRPEQAVLATNLFNHINEYVIPRIEDLTSPLVVVLLGSTGAGKSSLFNSIAGRPLSEVGVIRPTTRTAQGLVHETDALPEVLTRLQEQGLLHVTSDPKGLNGLLLIDAPDLDSVEKANRTLARRLLEAADLIIFVTTDTRYADDVPWSILERAKQRGVPFLAVVNRLPLDEADRSAVMGDFRRLLMEGGFEEIGAGKSLQIVGVPKNALEREIRGLDRAAVAPILNVLAALADDEASRRAMVREGLGRAVDGLQEPIASIADEIEVEAAAATKLLEKTDRAYTRHKGVIDDRINRGTFLRSEVLREWHDFVGANRVARVISEGVGKLAAAIRSAFNPGPVAPTQQVKESALEDLIGLVVSQADESASESASSWASDPYGALALESEPALWGAAPTLNTKLREELEEWAGGISIEIAEMGEDLRGFAKVASLGVNVVGTGAILAVFVHTGGLTGAEAGVAALTAIVNQTLLEAIFGEGNVQKFVDRARARLDVIISGVFDAERQRFTHALPISPDASGQAERLRGLADVVADARLQ